MKQCFLSLLLILSILGFATANNEIVWQITKIEITTTMNTLDVIDYNYKLTPRGIEFISYDFINENNFLFTINPSYDNSKTNLIINRDTLRSRSGYTLHFGDEKIYIWSENSKQYFYSTYSIEKDSLTIDDWWGKKKYAGKLIILGDTMVYTIETKDECRYNRHIFIFEKLLHSISGKIDKNFFEKNGYTVFKDFSL